MEKIIAKRVLSRKVPASHPLSNGRTAHRVVAVAQLHHLEGNQRPYFSLTGEVHNPRITNGDSMVSCGAMGDKLVKLWPKLAVVERLHLADDNGVPMHAVENAAYWLGFTSYQEADVRLTPDSGLTKTALPYFPYFRNLWRVSHVEALDIYQWCRDADNIATYGSPRECLRALHYWMLPRWANEAAEALAFLNADG